MFEKVSSQKQITANRANAKKSTGPTTPGGKEKSKLNACRHNLTGQVHLLTEGDMDQYLKFTREYTAELAPEGIVEKNLAQNIADAQWRLNRARSCEDAFFCHELGVKGPDYDINLPEAHTGIVHGVAFIEHSKDFANVTLYEQRLTSQMHKNLRLLRDLQQNRPLEKAAPKPKVMVVGSVEPVCESAVSPAPVNNAPLSAAPLNNAPADRTATNRSTKSTASPEIGFDFSNDFRTTQPGPKEPESVPSALKDVA